MRVLAVTGYKPMEMNIFKPDDVKIQFIKLAIKKRVLEFLDLGLEWVLVSGQSGVEMWTVDAVMELKEDYDIKIGIIPPFENQAERWPEQIREQYELQIAEADFYKPLYSSEYKGPYQFQAKNKWFVAKSDACLFLMDPDFPGSNRFLHEAALKAENYPIYMITPSDLDDTVNEYMMSQPDYWE